MLRNQVAFVLFFLGVFPSKGLSQEITIFKVSDFDLRGQVKSCLVSTDYGKEEYQFDESGRLTQAATRFSEEDYDITLYKYKNNELIEKRVESYRGQALDKATSIANFYTYDSTKNRRVTEKIITYEKEFLDQYEYSYTADNKLSKIIRTNNEGIDETSVVYYDNGAGANYILNRETQKSVNTKIESPTDSTQFTTRITKKFQDGKPNERIDEIFDANGKLTSIARFLYNADLEKFVPEKKTLNFYDANGTKLKTEIRLKGEVIIEEFIYQYDPRNNWVKQIITPARSYKTRKIKYYENEEASTDVKGEG